MDTSQTPLFTMEELCDYLLIGRNTAYKLLNTGKLRAFRIGRTWKIPRENIQEYLKTECFTKAA